MSPWPGWTAQKALPTATNSDPFSAVAKRRGTQDIIPRLVDRFITVPTRDTLNRREDSTVVVNPFLSLIAATPAEYVQDLLSNLEIEGGFLNRFLTITGKVKGWKAIAPPPSGWETFTKPIRDIGPHYDDHECRFEWTAESQNIWTQFYIDRKESRREMEREGSKAHRAHRRAHPKAGDGVFGHRKAIRHHRGMH